MRSESDLSSINESLVEVVVCYGTSCFARGNADVLELLNELAQQADSNITLRMTGRLCQGQCAEGPNLMIAGKLHNSVTKARLIELLNVIQKVDHGTA